MDDIKPKRGSPVSSRLYARSGLRAQPAETRPRNQPLQTRYYGKKYWLVRSLGKTASNSRQKLWHRFKDSTFAKWPDRGIWQRLYAFTILIFFIISTIAGILQPLLENRPYRLATSVRSVLPEPNQNLAQFLQYDAKESKFAYNAGYTGEVNPDLAKTGNGTPRISASFSQEPSNGVTVTDPINKTDFTVKPKFRLEAGKQDQNQIFYRLAGSNGYLVYSSQIATIKEDIVLASADKDRMVFEYELVMGEGQEARLEKDGSVGIYGSSLPINGNVATGSEQDAALLQKTRENGQKDKLLFDIPAPVVKESGKTKSSVVTRFELEGKSLRVVSEGLGSASYPLSIDPSVYVESAAQLMRGNNESNVAFDVDNELFKKGSTTGARIDEWTETGEMNNASYDQGVAVAGGYMYRAGGRSGRIMPWVASQQKTVLATTSTTFAMNMPAIRPSGDLYVAILSHDVSGPTGFSSVPAGWTQLADTREHAVFWHTGGASEPASYSWTKNGNAVQWAGVILRIKNANATFTTTAQNNATDANPVFPTVTPTSQGALVLRSASWDDDNVNAHGYAPTGHDEIASGMSGGATGVGFAVSRIDSPPLSGVATGTATMPTSQNILDSYGSSSIAIYGSTATPAYNQTLQWARFNSTTGGIDSPAPGSNGAVCSGWCTDAAYNLPTGGTSSDGVGNVGMSMVAYNGYLYAMGGNDGTTLKSTVYIAKLGANGEPSLWHPTDPNQANWVYWYKDTGLNGATARAYHSAYAYNGKMYILGGDTNTTANSGASSTVELADILPNGTLGTWASGQALSGGNRYGASVQAYNGYLYILGGNNNGTMLNLTQYSRLNSDGTMNSWQTAAVDGSNTFNTARSSQGGIMSGIWGGYIYLAGGCSVVNAAGLCTTVASDVQLASINADGSLDAWNTMANLRNTRFGSSFISWQGKLYRFGGCSRQDATTGDCYATHLDIQYGAINQDGDASTVSITTASGSGLCVGNDPYDCSLPPGGDGAGQGGQALSATVILNGYLYVIGGCTTNACTDMSGNTSYTAIGSDGKLKSPPSCSGSTYGSWCIDSTNRVNGTTGVGAAGVAIFGGTIYIIGGQNGNAAVGNIYRNTTNADGSFTEAWSAAQTLTSVGAESVSYTYAYARANPASAGSNPGNLYLFGGCSSPAAGAGCTTDTAIDSVYKCNITSTGTVAGCSKTSQLQIGTVSGGNAPGLAIHAGSVYANYIYLVGGVGRGAGSLDLKTIRYAKFDNSNNVVAVSGGAWIESANQTSVGRRRGSAFGYNGYLYVVGGFDASVGGTLNDIQFAKINVSDGSIGVFQTSAVTINQRWGLGLVVSNSYAYVIGGCKDGTSPTCNAGGLDDTVQTFQVYNNDSGAPGLYTKETDLFGTDRLGASAAVHNGYLYIAGGCVSLTDCTNATAGVRYAPLDAYGGVGVWTIGDNLPAARAWGQLEVAGGSLYFMGGQPNVATNERAEVYYSTGFTSGNPTWSTATTGLPEARTKFSSTVWNNRIYVVGGLDINAANTSTVYVSPQLNSGGDITSAWSTASTSFNVARSGLVAVAYANNLYILGGYNGTEYLSDVQFAQINSTTGDVGNWTYSTSLPSPLAESDGFAVNGYMYLFGGRTSINDCQPRTLVAPISANTTIASGNNPTGIGEWYQTNRNFDGGRYGAAAAFSQGKAYVLGGGCQGVVMQDDFDPGIDTPQWSYTTGATADTICKSTSSTNTLRVLGGNTNNNYAATKDVNIDNGGTINFKLYIPQANTGGCLQPENPGLFGVQENVVLQYSTNGGGAWTTLATYTESNAAFDPLSRVSATVSAAVGTTATRFRWKFLDAASHDTSDMFAIEDLSIIASSSTEVSYTGDSRVAYTPLLSQPQVASYSRLIDADKDVFPTNFLMNGLDNSIGARWQMRYRSMNDPTVTDVTKACGGSAMSAYGQETNFGDVTLGRPELYIVKNNAGTNISCGRYFFMTINIDASQTYGYPDDVARGPTLSDVSLFFKANPGKRLIHGKTFIEGTQQPLDTPCGQSNYSSCPSP